MSSSLTTWVPSLEVEAVVEYEFTPGTPDHFYTRHGDPGDPGDPPEVELLKVVASGHDVTEELTDDDRKYIERDVEEHEAYAD